MGMNNMEIIEMVMVSLSVNLITCNANQKENV